ncbi:MAG: hypothetical protein ACOYOH_18765 [Paracraurococcus sp.]
MVEDLDRPLFEYQLETLTSRGEEKQFENFCRLLLQREICPNLLPQTGPTGGGDSKVDSETYPVASEISERWFEGHPEAGSERWAFAFSAKRDWRPKVKSDVEKIAGTKRGYVRAYFVSNQFIPDRQRAEVEDALTREHGMAVHIFDRTWIVETVFARRLFDLAASALGMRARGAARVPRTGPGDASRQVRLREIEQQIATYDERRAVEYQLVEDCLEAAIVSRELELPRQETEGRFDRAKRLAVRLGSRQQLLNARYQHAWTCIYWFDDFDQAALLYGPVEELVLATLEADDAARLSNLWTSLAVGVRSAQIARLAADFDVKTEKLKAHLQALAADTRRPNNAAHAKALLVNVAMVEAAPDTEKMGACIAELADLMEQSQGLGGFPFDQFAQIFQELGDQLAGSDTYDEAFERFLPVLERRRSEGEAGKALLRRGLQKVRNEEYYDAIRHLGRAQQKLIKLEYRSLLIKCCAAVAHAYDQVGLHWAARAQLVNGSATAMSDFRTDGHVTRAMLRCVNRLAWCELSIGRVPRALSAMELVRIIGSHVDLDDAERQDLAEELHVQDMVLGILLLKAVPAQLVQLEALPASLAELGLPGAAAALLYALGDIPVLKRLGFIPEEETGAQIDEIFERLLRQPAAGELPEQPELLDGEETVLLSRALGCEWFVIAPTEATGLALAECILAFIEAFFATSLLRDAAPKRQRIRIRVRQAEKAVPGAAHLRLLVDGVDLFDVEYSSDFDQSDEARTGALSNLFYEAIPHLIFRVLFLSEPETYLDRVLREEEGLSRSFAAAHAFVVASDVVPDGRGTSMVPWLHKEIRFPVLRREALRQSPLVQDALPPKAVTFGEGEPPEGMRNPERLSHGKRRIFSVINVDLWDQAGWRGVASGILRPSLPFVGFMFKDRDVAIRIFEEWRAQYGMVDKDEEIRIALVTGINRKAPASYRTVIGSGAALRLDRDSKYEEFYMITRMQTMDSPDPKNITTFLEAYRKIGKYILLPVVLREDRPDVLAKYGILKRELIVREAWTIGENDPDMMALADEDDPFVPVGIENPPMRKALARRREMSRRRG